MLLAVLAAVSRRVGGLPSRNAKIAQIAGLLRRLAPDEVEIGASWLAGIPRQGRSGIGYALIRDARPATFAAAPSLTLAEVDAALGRIADTRGPGSTNARVQLLTALLSRATADEYDFLTRLLLGELRQGALEGLMIDAVAAAAGVPVKAVRRAAMVGGGIAAVAHTALGEGSSALGRHAMAIFAPVAPMLAQAADDVEGALAPLGVAALEWKLDGARIQAHKRWGEVRIYSRTGNDVTAATPEVVAAVRDADAHTLILDGEAIALKPDGAPFPFQETMSRFGRILDIDEMRKRYPLSVFFFDCLRRDDQDLLARPASARHAALAAVLRGRRLAPRLVTGDVAAAAAFYEEAVARGHEGVMVKALDASYEPGARSASWRKVKRSHTLDLVVLAAEWGHGRRRGWLSNLHLGAADPATGGFVMLGKTFKGMTDAMLQWQTAELLKREVARGDGVVHVRPELVVEVAFNDLQRSPRYPGGLALRFARVKGYRPDKDASGADTMESVRSIFAGQQPAAAQEPPATRRSGPRTAS